MNQQSPTKPQIAAIVAFFDAVAELRNQGVIRSDKYLGDLGEYICQHFYAIELAASGRQPGYDGINTEGLVQVKYHGSSTRTNIDLGNPNEYDILLIVLGPSSLLRPKNHTEDFLIYRMTSATVHDYLNKKTSTWSCGRQFFNKAPDNAFNLSIPTSP